MIQKNLHAFFLSACFLTGAVAANAQQSSGKLTLSKGQKILASTVVKSVTSIEMMGQSMEIVSDGTIDKQLEVKDKKDKSYIVSSMITRMVTSGNAMGQSFDYDSDKKSDTASESAKALGAQVNVPKEIELNTEGVAINVKEAAVKAEDGGNPMMEMMKKMGGKEDGNSPSDIFAVLPAGKKSGDTWSDSTISEGIKIYRTYVIKEIKGNDATVTITGNQVVNKTAEMMGQELTITMDGKLSGDQIVDIATGVIKQRTFVVDGTGTLEAQGQSIPLTTKVTTTTTVK